MDEFEDRVVLGLGGAEAPSDSLTTEDFDSFDAGAGTSPTLKKRIFDGAIQPIADFLAGIVPVAVTGPARLVAEPALAGLAATGMMGDEAKEQPWEYAEKRAAETFGRMFGGVGNFFYGKDAEEFYTKYNELGGAIAASTISMGAGAVMANALKATSAAGTYYGAANAYQKVYSGAKLSLQDRLLTTVFSSGRTTDAIAAPFRQAAMTEAAAGNLIFSTKNATLRPLMVKAAKDITIDNFKKAMAFNLGAFSLYGNDDLFAPEYSFADHLSTSIVWDTAITGLSIPSTVLGMRKTVSKLAKVAWDSRARNIAIDTMAAVSQTPNDRGLALTLNAMTRNETKALSAMTSINQKIAERASTDSTIIEGELSKIIKSMNEDKLEVIDLVLFPITKGDTKLTADGLKAVQKQLDSDPAVWLNTQAIRKMPNRPQDVSKTITAEVKRLEKEMKKTPVGPALEEMQKKRKKLDSVDFLALDATGNIVPLHDFVPMPPVTISKNDKAYTSTITGLTGSKHSKRWNVMRDTYNPDLGKATWGELDYRARDQIYQSYGKMIQDGDITGGQILSNDSWLKVDAIAESIKRGNLDANAVMVNPLTLERLGFKFVPQSAEEFELLSLFMKAKEATQLDKLPTPAMLRHQFNLPTGIGGFQTAAEAFVGNAALTKNMPVIQSVDDFKQQLAKFITGGPADGIKNLALKGKLLSPERNEPVLVAVSKIDVGASSTSRAALINQVAAKEALRKKALATDPNSLVGVISRTANNLAAIQEAKKMDRLVEGAMGAPNVVTTFDSMIRHNPTLASARAVADLSYRQYEIHMSKVFETPMSTKNGMRKMVDVFAEFRSSKNVASQTRFNIYDNARLHGFEVMEGKPDVLAKTATNEKLLNKYFPDLAGALDAGEEVILPNMNHFHKTGKYLPVELDDLSLSVIEAMRTLGDDLLHNANILNTSEGKRAISRKEYWMPAPSPKGMKKAVVVRNPKSESIVLFAKSDHELDALIEAERKLYPMARSFKENELDNYFAIKAGVADDAFLGWLNYGDSMQQTGKGRGALGSVTLPFGTERLDSALDQISNTYYSLARRSVAANFAPELEQARRAHVMSGFEGTQNSIWQTYTNIILNKQSMREKSVVGTAYGAIESVVNRGLGVAASAVEGLGAPRFATPRQKKEFEAIEKAMSNHNPYKNAADMVQQRWKIAPPDTQKVASANNKLVSSLILRIGNVSNAIMNGLSLASNTPAVLSALKQRAGESVVDWQHRTNLWGITLKDGTTIPDYGRVVMRATARMFSKKDDALVERAAQLGLFDSDVMLLRKAIFRPDTRSSKHAETVINAASFISDHSETLARKWAFFTGVEYADMIGNFSHLDDKLLFAHRVANQIIADYSPMNKPQVFQGPVGMPVGLFQTFTWNLYDRMFDYIQRKDIKSLAVQYAMHGSFYGAESLPGWSQLVDGFAKLNRETNEEMTTADIIASKLPPDVVTLLTTGVIEALTGVAVSTRGYLAFENPQDMVMRVASQGLATTIGNLPGFAAVRAATGFLGDMLSSAEEGGQFSKARVLESLSANSINPLLRWAIDTSQGYAVDRQGNMVNSQVESWMGINERLFGFRPSHESQEMEAYYKNRESMAKDSIIMENITQSLKPIIRSGKLDEDSLADAIHDYYKAGGDPKNFATFLNNLHLTSIQEKAEKQFLNLIKSKRIHELNRMSHLFIGKSFEEESTESFE